jgi:hypothetical protein
LVHSPRRPSSAAATATALALLALLARAASAQTLCAPGSFLSAPSTCAPCPANTYSFGGAAPACAACAAGDAFVSASLGCAPAWGDGAVQGAALYVAGASGAGLQAVNLPAAQSGPVLDVDHLGRAAGAVRVAQEYYTTGALPQLPTGNGARTLSAWVQCAAAATPQGPTLFELSDPSGSALRQGFSVRAPAGAAALSGTTPPYSSQIVAGNPPLGTCANIPVAAAPGTGDGVGTTASFYNSQNIRAGPVSGNIFIADYGNFRIRMYAPSTGMVTTLAGAASGFVDNAVGTNARMANVADLVIDPLERFIVFSDLGNNRIRMLNRTHMN